MYYYRVGISAEEHDRFVRRSSLVNLLQSSAWASVKSEWENERVGFYSDNQIVAEDSLLFRSLSFGFSKCYISRGLIFCFTYQTLMGFVFFSL